MFRYGNTDTKYQIPIPLPIPFWTHWHRYHINILVTKRYWMLEIPELISNGLEALFFRPATDTWKLQTWLPSSKTIEQRFSALAWFEIGFGHEYYNHLIIHNRNLIYSQFGLQKWLSFPGQPLYNHRNPWAILKKYFKTSRSILKLVFIVLPWII